MRNLTPAEISVLTQLAECGEEYCLNFSQLMVGTNLTRPEIRASCRSLADIGFAHYTRGLWFDDECKPAGSGYGITEAGTQWINARTESPLCRYLRKSAYHPPAIYGAGLDAPL